MIRRPILLTAFLFLCTVLRAEVVVNTSLSLTSFTINSADSVQFSGVSTSVYAQAADNLGELDRAPGSTSTSAAVSLASASATADGSALTTSSASGVNIPSLNAAVLPGMLEANSQLSGYFEIMDAMNTTINVSIGATLTSDQYLFTDPYGISADSEVNFQFFDSNGDFLSYYNSSSIGSDTTSDTPVSQPLSASALLDTNTPYFFFLETDAESDGFDSAVPEPSSLLLLATLLVSLAACCRLRRGQN